MHEEIGALYELKKRKEKKRKNFATFAHAKSVLYITKKNVISCTITRKAFSSDHGPPLISIKTTSRK